MHATATTILGLTLDDVRREDELHDWIVQLVELLERRFKLVRACTYALARGSVELVLEFPLPGTWKFVREHDDFAALLADCPEGELTERRARRWHADGNPRDLTTSTLERWIRERDAGQRDLVVADALPAESFARLHLPGAVHLPLQEALAEHVDELLGPDKHRIVVVYCAGFECPESTRVAERLVELGWRAVYEYPGGLDEWAESGLPLEGELGPAGLPRAPVT